MNLLMISGDRSILEGRKGAFWHTLQGLSKHWERIDIICPRPKYSGEETNAGIQDLEKHSVFFHPNPGGILSQSRWITKKGAELHQQHQYAAMTIHEYPPFYNGKGALRLAERTDIPTLLEVHHIVGHPTAASLTEWIGRLLSRRVLPAEAQRASAVRTVNGEVKSILMSWGVPEEKFEVLPSFYLDRELLTNGSEQNKEFDLVFCARLVANKGLEQVLEALTQLPDVTLLVIGDGPKKEAWQKYAKALDVLNRVTFTGWLPTQQDVIAAMRSARVFVMNSTSEGGPRSALEAMACGLPVITTPVGVMPDVLDEGVNGLFTTGEAPDLVDCIQSLLANPDACSAMGWEATKVLERFERDRLIQDYSDFLRTLL